MNRTVQSVHSLSWELLPFLRFPFWLFLITVGARIVHSLYQQQLVHFVVSCSPSEQSRPIGVTVTEVLGSPFGKMHLFAPESAIFGIEFRICCSQENRQISKRPLLANRCAFVAAKNIRKCASLSGRFNSHKSALPA